MHFFDKVIEEYPIIKQTPKGFIEEFMLNTNKVYLAVSGEEKIYFNLKISGEIETSVSCKSDDESIAVIDDKYVIHGISVGETRIHFWANEIEKNIDVIVTNLIIPAPDEPNGEKELITGHKYTKEENDLLDEILEDRINKAGYQTRAGTVAAARFICLEFPYRIPYFSENGRLNGFGNTYYVDGEGRYYHKGLYLNSSRFDGIIKSMYGPATWGSYMYCYPSEGQRANGFDCSGFISWIVLNGGFDSGDLGAGLADHLDMTDLGEKIKLTTSIENKALKAGDLLSGKGSDGGHIALIAGISGDKVYVAESLWVGTGNFGAIIKSYEYNKLTNNFYWHVDMDEFYGEDGNYTEFWK